MVTIKRAQYSVLEARLSAPLATIQVLVGPRQVGKTTLIRQILDAISIQSFYHTADAAKARDAHWIAQHWAVARAYYALHKLPVLLCFDEIQKVKGWSEIVKIFVDEDRYAQRDIRFVLSGSSTLQLETGLFDSLAGRYEKTVLTHWTYAECRAAFGVSLETYIRFGGYP